MLSDAKQIAIIISLIKNGNMTKTKDNIAKLKENKRKHDKSRKIHTDFWY